jgi:adenylate kinase
MNAPHGVRLVLLGPPGAGKGTQAKLIEDRLGAPQISTGDILRKHVADGTELGKEAKGYMNSGGLVPDSIILGMMAGRLAEDRGFILDGFPRTVAQAEALDGMLAELGKPLGAVLLFDADRAALIARLTGRWSNPRSGRTYHADFNPPRVAGIDDEDGGPLVQRPDDSLGVVENRLNTYDAQTAPLVGYYEGTGLLRHIDALQPIEVVTAHVLQAVEGIGAAA